MNVAQNYSNKIILFTKPARERTREIPLKFGPPFRLSQEAAITMASVPEARGAEKIAYVVRPVDG